MRVSPSQLKVWKDCRMAWHYSYEEGLRLKKSAKHFDIGTYTHELLHVLYQTLKATGWKPGSDEVLDMMRARIDSDMEELDLDNIEIMATVWPIVSKFVAQQSPVIDRGIEVLGVEIEIMEELDNGLFLHGFIDLVYRDSAGRIRIRDHKTSGQKNAWTVDKIKMDPQLMMYAIGMSMQLGEPIYDVEINFINTYAYKNKLPPFEDLYKLLRYSHNEHSVKMFTSNLLEIHDDMLHGKRYRTYGSACANCRFKELCHLETRGQDSTPVKLSMYQKIEREQ